MAKKSADKGPSGPATISNRKARFDYEILQTFEAGIALIGSEVKSIFMGRAHLTDAYIEERSDELWLLGMDVEPYVHSSHFQPERRRERKLLMHRQEIDLIGRRAQEKGLTIIPLKLYFKNGKVKVELGLARGKRLYDKRQSLQEKETRRERERYGD